MPWNELWGGISATKTPPKKSTEADLIDQMQAPGKHRQTPGAFTHAENLLKAFCRFLNLADIRILLDVDLVFYEAELPRNINIALQRFKVRQQVRVAISILLCEQPTEALRRGLRYFRRDLRDLVMVFRIEEPARDAQHVLHEIHHGGAVLVDE